MVTTDSSNRVRLSAQATRNAGFRPGQKLAVVSEGQNSFRISLATRATSSSNSARYSVEKDGRLRVNRNVLRSLGVKSRRKTMTAQVEKGSILVTM